MVPEKGVLLVTFLKFKSFGEANLKAVISDTNSNAPGGSRKDLTLAGLLSAAGPRCPSSG